MTSLIPKNPRNWSTFRATHWWPAPTHPMLVSSHDSHLGDFIVVEDGSLTIENSPNAWVYNSCIGDLCWLAFPQQHHFGGCFGLFFVPGMSKSKKVPSVEPTTKSSWFHYNLYIYIYILKLKRLGKKIVTPTIDCGQLPMISRCGLVGPWRRRQIVPKVVSNLERRDISQSVNCMTIISILSLYI